MRRLSCALAALFLTAAAPARDSDRTKPVRKVDFAREVRPILARCFQCHGPDEKARKAGLRLDVRAGAVKKLDSGDTAIVPKEPGKSELLARVMATDDSLVMPPTKVGKGLTAAEVS